VTGYSIILNGPSSAGKSTLAKAIQKRFPDERLLHFTMDSFLNMAAPGKLGDFPNLLGSLIDCAVVHLKNHNHNLVMDTVFQPSASAKLRTRLNEFNTVSVGIYAPLAIREEREVARGDRKAGTTASQENTIHVDAQSYDLTLDTSLLTVDDAADQIMAFYKSRFPAP
jgi:chloramphenicol 3-O phosphotransferase